MSNQQERRQSCQKKIFLIRHGVALHNVRSTMQDINHGDCRLFDANLIQEGRLQAQRTGELFFSNFSASKVDLMLVSPHSRCLQTCQHFIAGGNIASRELPEILCKEDLREIFGIHQADRRRNKTELLENWPSVKFSLDMPEKDERWQPNRRESWNELSHRVHKFFTNFISSREEKCIIIISHGVWIECCLHLYSPDTLRGGADRIHNCNVVSARYDEETRKLLPGAKFMIR